MKEGREQDELLDSNYDGIQEYDNSLPRWWLILFYITIAIAPFYTWYYHFSTGQSYEQQLPGELAKLEEQRRVVAAAQSAAAGKVDLVALVQDSGAVAKGKEVYLGRCAACHGNLGEGLVGPNLVDAYWIHGGKIEDIKHTIEIGVLEKGMLAWKGVLSDEDINAVVAFVWSIRGTTPPNSKAPQGELVDSADGGAATGM